MAKKTQKQRVQSEKNNAGCMSGLISIFDFRQGHSTQKLLSDRRHGSARHAGIGRSKGNLNSLASSEEKPKSLNNVDGSEGRVDFSTSVKILMEEEMSRVQQPKKNPKANTEQIKPIEVSYEKNHRKASETSVLPCDPLLNDKTRSIPDKSNNVNKTERFLYNIHLPGLLEEICGDKHQCQRLLMEFKRILDSCSYQESADKVPCDLLDQPDTQLGQDHSTIHKVLIETAEALLDQDLKAISSETSNQSEELLNALEILNSKELLLKLLQDRCSYLVKHIEEIKNDQQGNSSKPELGKLIEEPNMSSKQSEEPVSHKMFQRQNMHKFFRKKDKLQEAKVSNGNDSAQPLSKIVVLKPTPPRDQNSSNAISLKASQSGGNLRAETEKGRVASHFSLKEIKRRLKHVIGDNGKGQHILSMDGVLHRIRYETQRSPSGDSDSKFKDGGQAKSVSKISHCKEEPSQLTSNTKKKEKLKLKESRSNIMHEAAFQDKNLSLKTTTSLHREYSFQREARKHLAEMFNTVDSEANLPSIQTSRSLGRMLSLSEYNFLSPRLSPGREKESSLSPRQMRFSPFWQLKQEDGKHSSPLRESIGDLPCTEARRSLDQLCDSDLNTQRQDISIGETSVQENLSSGEISSPKECATIMEQPDNEHTQEREILNVPSELSIGDPTSAVERSKEDHSSLLPRATPPEMSQTVTLLVPSTPITLLVHDIRSPDTSIEKPERPSPVSVLEPLFTDDDSSPVACTDGHVDLQAQPHHICFDERESSAVVLTTLYHGSNDRTCSEDKECRFEYVRAVLEASGLLEDLLSDRWHSSPLLSPSLYDEVEYSSEEFPDDLKLLFDSINEVLEVLRHKFSACSPWVSLAKPGIRPLPPRENFISEVWRGVDQHFLSQAPHTLEQIVGKDMEVEPWMDLRSVIDSIGNDVGDSVLDNIMEEALLDLWT